jgi:hemoglobin
MDKHEDNARVFFALWPDAAERSAFSVWQEKLKGMGRAMDPEALHMTLVFLGQVMTSRLEELKQAGSGLHANAFELDFDEIRFWEHNRIVYAAPNKVPDALKELVAGLEQNLLQLGFDFDRREHRPHVTLFRNVRKAVLPRMDPFAWRILDYALVQSQGSGMGYKVLARFPLQKVDMLRATHYERIGGEEKVRELVERFYELMDNLPETYGIRKMHPGDLKGSIDKLFKFLSGWMGGPQLYVQEFGEPFLRRRHFPFAIASAERDQWMMCMRQALIDVVEDEKLRRELADAFARLADHMRNREG